MYVEFAQKYMKSIILLVLYLQGYDEGQKCLKISSNFKFDVPAVTDPYTVRPCNYIGL